MAFVLLQVKENFEVDGGSCAAKQLLIHECDLGVVQVKEDVVVLKEIDSQSDISAHFQCGDSVFEERDLTTIFEGQNKQLSRGHHRDSEGNPEDGERNGHLGQKSV